MAEILFRPVCSKCRTELHSVIDYQAINFRGFIDGVVEPGRCPYCGAWFTSIEMPTRLPFDNVSNSEKEEQHITNEIFDFAIKRR